MLLIVSHTACKGEFATRQVLLPVTHSLQNMSFDEFLDFRADICILCTFVSDISQLGASQRAKKGLKSSRDKNEDASRSGEGGGGEPAM